MINPPRLLLKLSLLSLCLVGAAATHATPQKGTQTLEASVEGLNCALCSDAMKVSLKKATGAKDIEPRLECGRIYFEVDPAASFNEAALTFALTANGFNLKGIRPTSTSLSQVRAVKESC